MTMNAAYTEIIVIPPKNSHHELVYYYLKLLAFIKILSDHFYLVLNLQKEILRNSDVIKFTSVSISL